MNATNAFEERILNTHRGITAVAPSAITVGLFLNNPGEAGGGTEVVYPEYERPVATFTSPLLGTIRNDVVIQWPTPSIAAGTATHVGFYDGTTMLVYAELSTPLILSAGLPPTIETQKAEISAVNRFSTAFRAIVLDYLRGTSIPGATPTLRLFDGDPAAGGSEFAGLGYAPQEAVFAAPATNAQGHSYIALAEDTAGITAGEPWGVWRYTAAFLGNTMTYIFPPQSPASIKTGSIVKAKAGTVQLQAG